MLYARSDAGLGEDGTGETAGTWLLLEHADSPDDTLVRSYATVIGACCDPHGHVFVPALGLELPYFRGLLATCFPRFIAPSAWLAAQSYALVSTGPLAEFPDLVGMLLDYRAADDQDHRCIAHLVASACMCSDHLWQDLGLPNRGALSALLATHFPALAAKNSGDMKWKKFFYRQLCEREGFHACSAPNCAACADYSRCFAPEN